MGCVVMNRLGSSVASAPTQGVSKCLAVFRAPWILEVSVWRTRAGGHRDLRAHRANLEGHIHAPHLLAFQQDVIGDEGLEAGLRGAQTVAAAVQIRDFEIAVLVGLDGPFLIGLQIDDRYLRASDNRPTWVGRCAA